MLARMVLPLSVVGMLFGSSSSSSGSTLTSLTAGGGSSSISTASAGSIKSALVNAEKNEAKQMEQVAKDPQIQKDLARYEKVVKKAKSLDEVLDEAVLAQFVCGFVQRVDGAIGQAQRKEGDEDGEQWPVTAGEGRVAGGG